MNFHYHLYGLNVESDVALPDLQSHTAPWNHNSRVKFFLHDAITHWPIETGADESTLMYDPTQDGAMYTVRIDYFHAAKCYRFVYSDGVAFALGEDGTNVWGSWPPQFSLKYAMVYLLGPVLAFVLRLRGFIALHASAAVVTGNALAFVGPKGAGKSTIAGALAREGYQILGDDIAVLEEIAGEFCLRPAYPHLRLWPDASSILFGAKDALPKLVPSSEWDKRFLDLDQPGFRFQTEPAPLGCIFFLEDYSPEVQVAHIDEITTGDAFRRLLAYTYRSYGLTTRMRASEFHELGRLVHKVAIKRLTLGSSPDWITRLGPFLERVLARGSSKQSQLESVTKGSA